MLKKLKKKKDLKIEQLKVLEIQLLELQEDKLEKVLERTLEVLEKHLVEMLELVQEEDYLVHYLKNKFTNRKDLLYNYKAVNLFLM